MGLNPLDLQTMYSQLNNVAKQVSHQTQGAQLSQAMQQNQLVQQNLEEAKKVLQARENSKSKDVDLKSNSKGHSSGEGAFSQKKKEGEDDSEKKENSSPYTLKESYLGQHIDIKR